MPLMVLISLNPVPTTERLSGGFKWWWRRQRGADAGYETPICQGVHPCLHDFRLYTRDPPYDSYAWPEGSTRRCSRQPQPYPKEDNEGYCCQCIHPNARRQRVIVLEGNFQMVVRHSCLHVLSIGSQISGRQSVCLFCYGIRGSIHFAQFESPPF